MSNPFKKISKNAEQSKNSMYTHEIRTDAKVSTRQCNSCGAPRPKNTDLTSCNYCNTSFMDIDETINSDT